MAAVDKRGIEKAMAKCTQSRRQQRIGHWQAGTKLLVLIGRLAMIVDSCAIGLLGWDIWPRDMAFSPNQKLVHRHCGCKQVLADGGSQRGS
jgi:hypothetical protein